MIDNYVIKDFGKILKSNHQKLRSELTKSTNAMRVYEKCLEALKFSVDLFANWAVITDYTDSGFDEQTLDKIKSTIASNLYISKDNIIYKHKKKGVEFIGLENPVNIQIKEDDAIYNLELAQKQDVGFFLDNYRARLLIKELSFGRRVLNLFSYTAAYSVQAARGGAEKVVSVDTSQSALNIAKQNMKDNNFIGDNFEFIQKDVFEYLETVKPSYFDIIIIDAPSFSNAHGGRRANFDIQKDHIRLIECAKKALRAEGVIFLRTNLSTFRLDSDKLSDFKIFNYTREMLSPGFSKKSQIVKTFVLKLYGKRKYYINSKKR